jgi:hypothetical protein
MYIPPVKGQKILLSKIEEFENKLKELKREA